MNKLKLALIILILAIIYMFGFATIQAQAAGIAKRDIVVKDKYIDISNDMYTLEVVWPDSGKSPKYEARLVRNGKTLKKIMVKTKRVKFKVKANKAKGTCTVKIRTVNGRKKGAWVSKKVKTECIHVNWGVMSYLGKFYKVCCYCDWGEPWYQHGPEMEH